MQSPKVVGFVGLGQMGGPMAANIAKSGMPMIVYDKAGTKERAPKDATIAGSLAEVIAGADTVFLSVPDGPVSISIVKEIAAMNDRRACLIVDLSTIGPAAAEEAGGIVEGCQMVYADAPVSGGQSGAIAGTITIMFSGPDDAVAANMDVLKSFSKNVFHVGTKPGQGQSVKILNNYLSATAMAATSEAVLYGLSQGIDMKTILEVVNVSTGMNTASLDKFPKRVLTETFDAGFKTKLLAKDVKLFLENAKGAKTPNQMATVLSSIWQGYAKENPEGDFTLVYKYIRDKT